MKPITTASCIVHLPAIIALACAGAAIIQPAAVALTTYTWAGAPGGATWDTTATNWSGGTDPWNSTNGPNDIASINGGTINVSGNVYASGILFTGVTQNGISTLILSGTNSSFLGTFTLTQGTLQFNSTSAFGGGGGDTVNVSAGGAVVLNGATDISSLVGRVTTTSTGAIALNVNSSTAIDFNAAGLTAASLGASGGTRTYSGTLTPAGSTYRLGGAVGTLTLTTSPLAGDNSLVVNGTTAGTSAVDIAVANTYTGTTTLNGGTLILSVAETPARPAR